VEGRGRDSESFVTDYSTKSSVAFHSSKSIINPCG
jgi:hypothetical protein